MARYDRIARLTPPDRDGAFPGWLTLRDLEGRERESELGRRARLRFLALRPIRRLLRRGIDGMGTDSFRRQIDGVREELGQLSPRDPERQRIAEYLKEMGGGAPTGIVTALLEVGTAAEAAGHGYAAEEFYRTGLELATVHDLLPHRLDALRSLGRVTRDREDWAEAARWFEEAADAATGEDHVVDWARAMEGLAATQRRAGRTGEARRTLDQVARRGDASREKRVRGIAAAGQCALELAEDHPEEALEPGWRALQLLAPDDEDRNAVLLNLGTAFRRLGLTSAAESAYAIVTRWSSWPERRVEATVEGAVMAAEAGDGDGFETRCEAVLDQLDHADAVLASLARLGLGRGAMLLGRTDAARDHLRDAIAIARDASLDHVLQRANELLDALEQQVVADGDRTPVAVGSATRRIAEQVESLGREVVRSG